MQFDKCLEKKHNSSANHSMCVYTLYCKKTYSHSFPARHNAFGEVHFKRFSAIGAESQENERMMQRIRLLHEMLNFCIFLSAHASFALSSENVGRFRVVMESTVQSTTACSGDKCNDLEQSQRIFAINSSKPSWRMFLVKQAEVGGLTGDGR